MASGQASGVVSGTGSRQVYGQVLSTVMAQKQECLQYLTVDTDTYLHWRTLARNLELDTDCDVAAFLLQHYDKMSDVQLTQCVKCEGPVVQYCLTCNIYMTQPTTASTLLLQQQESSATTSASNASATCDHEVVMPGDTILIDATTDGEVESVVAVPPQPQQSSEEVVVGEGETEQQLVMVKTDNLGEVTVGEVRGQTMSANQLEALVEACAMQEMTLDPHATTTTTTTTTIIPPTTTTTTTTTIPPTTKSLLTPEILKKLKSQIKPELSSSLSLSQQHTADISFQVEEEVGSLVSRAAELSGLQTTTTMTATTASQLITLRQLPASQADEERGVLRLVDTEGNTVVISSGSGSSSGGGAVDCLEIEAPQQLLATTRGGAASCAGGSVQAGGAATEVLMEMAAASSSSEAAVDDGGGVRAKDLTGCLLRGVVTKENVSDDESDYYCEPLFKPKSEDEDLQTAISIFEGRVSSHSILEGKVSGDVQLAAGLTEGDCLTDSQKVTTHDLAVLHCAGTDAETSQPDEPAPHGADAPVADSEQSDSAKVETTDVVVSDSHLERGESADPKMEPGKVVKNDAEEGTEPSVSDAGTDPAVGSARKRGRKRKMEADDSVADPSSSSPEKKEASPAANHTMRTRFFDKKRPSFVPLPSPPASPQKGQSSARGRRGRKPGSGRKETTTPREEERRGRGRKKKTPVVDEYLDDDDNDPDYQPDNREDDDDEVPDDGSHKERGDSGWSGTDPNPPGGRQESARRKDHPAATTDSRPEKPSTSADETEKKPDLKNRVIIITGGEDLEQLSLPAVRAHSLPSGSKVKTEGGAAITTTTSSSASVVVVKTETNVAPLETGGAHAQAPSRLAARVSIVTGDDDNGDDDDANGVSGGDGDGKPARKKRGRRRLHSKLAARTYACDMCEEQMGSRSELKQHLQQQHGARPFACPHCPATYKNRSHLRVHLNRHSEVKPFPCTSCSKSFASNYALTAHLTAHSTERPETCDICGRTFKSAKYLKGHRLLHGPVEKRFICQQCGARFNRKSNLLNHIKIHNGDKQFECPHCKRRFIQSGSLKSHVFRMHNPQRARSYVCEICGAARYAKDQFEKHMMIHTNTKPFKCAACGAAFVQSNALKGHMKIHTETEGKSHWCSICGAAFKKFASLKKHVHKIHHDYPDVSLTTVEFIEIQV